MAEPAAKRARSLDADLLVVGGGPGGAAAAIEAVRSGLDVVVIDKASFPREKCCGDGLTTGALRHLDDLGLDPATVPSWRPVDAVAVRTPAGRWRRFPLPDDAGTFAAVARRRELDASLLTVAASAGADVREGHALLDLARASGGDRVAATIDGPDGSMTVRSRYVIAADGMWSPTRKLLGVGPTAYRGDWHAFRQYVTGVTGRAARELLVWFEPDLLPGYAWSFPLAGGLANVGFGIQRRGTGSVQVMKELWPRLLARDHVVAALGPGATPEQPHRAWPIPTSLGRLPVTVGRVLFVGDALAAADPMTGEGIGQALETGRQAAASVARLGSDPDAVADRYRIDLERGMARDHRLARRLSRVLARPIGVEASVLAAGTTGWTRRQFGRWLFEDYPRAAVLTPARWRRGLLGRSGAFDRLAS